MKKLFTMLLIITAIVAVRLTRQDTTGGDTTGGDTT